MRFRFEAWTSPSSGSHTKLFDFNPLAGASGVRELSDWRDAKLPVSAASGLAEKLAGRWVKVFIGDVLWDEFEVSRTPRSTDRPGVIDLSGPSRNGVVEWGAILPPNWPNHKEGVLDWSWAGDSPLPPLGLGDLSSIKAQYELFLERERYELEVTATGGTYTLSVAGVTTDTINHNAAASTIRTRLEALTGITSVDVVRTGDGVFQIVFLDPTQVSPDLTVNTGSLTDGSASVTQENAGFDSTGATFTVEVTTDEGVETTDPLPWNVSARNFEGWGFPGLQGLSNVQDVTVTGTGVYSDPWVVTFYAPPNGAITDVTFAAGDAVLTELQAGVLDPAPITISKPADQQAGNPVDHGNYDTPALEVVFDPVNTGSDYSIKVNGVTQFAGQQLVVNVTPGETYSGLKVPINSEEGGRHALVVRTVFGDLIRRKEFTVAADTWTDLTVDEWTAPVGSDQVIIRVANVEASDVSPFYVDWQGVTLFRGQPAATFTRILLDLIEPIQTRGTLEFLHPAFTAAEDSAETELGEMAFLWRFGETHLGHVLEEGKRRGYQWRVVPCVHEGTWTHDLEVFYAPTGELREVDAVVRTATRFERVSRSPSRSVLFGHGTGGLVEEDVDSTLVSVIGRRERVVDAESAADSSALEDVTSAVFADDERNREALYARVVGSAPHIPGRDYVEGDKVVWQSSIQERVTKPVSRVGWSHGDLAEFEVSGSRVLSSGAALVESVDRLLREPKRRRGGETAPVVALPAPPANAATGAHLHLLAGSQAVDDEAVEWSSLFAAPLAFPTPSFPATEMVVQEPGYYPIYVHLAFSDWFGGGTVWVTRTRGGATSQVWPPPGVTTLWTSTGGSSFTGLVPALEWQSGDVIQVWFDGGEEVTLTEAVVVPWLADRSNRPASSGGAVDTAVTTFTTGGGTTVNFDLPSVKVGDLLVVIAATNEHTTTLSGSGWTLLATDTIGANRGSVWWKVSNGTETSDTLNSDSLVLVACGAAIRFRVPGMNWVSNPPEVDLATPATASPFVFPTTTPDLGAGPYFVVPFVTTRNFSAPTATPAGYDEVANLESSVRNLWVGMAELTISTSVSPGQVEATASSQPRAVWGNLLVRRG